MEFIKHYNSTNTQYNLSKKSEQSGPGVKKIIIVKQLCDHENLKKSVAFAKKELGRIKNLEDIILKTGKDKQFINLMNEIYASVN